MLLTKFLNFATMTKINSVRSNSRVDVVCQHTGACTWQILKNETHVYFISVTEIEYTWVFFMAPGG